MSTRRRYSAVALCAALTLAGPPPSDLSYALLGAATPSSAVQSHSPAAPDSGAGLLGRWVPAGSLSGRRASAFAVQLRGKRVLVGGGEGPGCLTTAELYSPSTNTWTDTGRMNVKRCLTSAVRLVDGRVLVVGGFGGGEEHLRRLRSCELYDPRTGRWTLTGSLHVARDSAALARTLRGRVLVAGGFADNKRALSSAEVYNPVVGHWTLTEPMAAARGGSWGGLGATRLPDGDVMVAGGFDENQPGAYLRSAERFDASTGTWHSAGQLSQRRDPWLFSLPKGRILAIAGDRPAGASAVVDVYLPEQDRWVPGPPLPVRRRGFQVAAFDGHPLLTGGYSDGLRPKAEAFLYLGPRAGWRRVEDMPRPRVLHAAVTVRADSSVLVVGGFARPEGTQQRPLATAVRYLPQSYGPVTSRSERRGCRSTSRLCRSLPDHRRGT